MVEIVHCSIEYIYLSKFIPGQSCCASSRVFVHEKAHDRFVDKLKAIADSKVVGDPFDV